jgi:hypothetical protein
MLGSPERDDNPKFVKGACLAVLEAATSSLSWNLAGNNRSLNPAQAACYPTLWKHTVVLGGVRNSCYSFGKFM